MTDDELKTYLDVALDLAGRAASIARQHFGSDLTVEFKDDSSPLTIADTSINTMVIDVVRATFPDHRVIGEEESFGTEGAEYAWVCDPIDGTIPFSRGYPTFVFSLALVRNGEPVLAVVTDPILDRTYVATKGGGTTCNGVPVHVAAEATFDRNVISVEGIRTHPRVDELRRRMSEAGAQWCRIQSCIYTAALVAAGTMGAMVYGGENPWDAVTPALLIQEAGGVVSDLDGNPQRYDGNVNGLVVAANPDIHRHLLEMLKTA